MNQTWLDQFGFSSKEEVIGKTWAGLNLISEPKQYKKFINQLKKNGYVQNAELYHKTASDEKRLFCVNLNRIMIGSTECILSTHEGITEQKSGKAIK